MFKDPLQQHGVATLRVGPKVSLSSKADATIMHRQGGQVVATESSLLDKEATGLFRGPRVCIRTTLATPFFSSTSGGRVWWCLVAPKQVQSVELP